jgi:hypothetical protein
MASGTPISRPGKWKNPAKLSLQALQAMAEQWSHPFFRDRLQAQPMTFHSDSCFQKKGTD